MAEFNEDYQYNSCISRGICSLSPRVSAMQTVVVLYLRLFAKFALEIRDKIVINEEIKFFILNVISITIYNLEFNEDTYQLVLKGFDKYLADIINVYFSEKTVENTELEIEHEKVLNLFKETEDVISSIKFGERVFQKSQKTIPGKIRDMYNILLVISKSLSINILDLNTYSEQFEEGFNIILEILSLMDMEGQSVDILKSKINDLALIDNKAMELLRETQEKRYGKQINVEVSYSTVPNKAVLVVGSNIRELENVLEQLMGENIDVYTHDEMMLAHTFPKFSEYKNLKGQFGQGVENCLLDFATFPGPIIFTKHSLHNTENLYRGLLFTTDLATSKGVMQIKENNFKEVILMAKKSKGFKNGKPCESVSIGYDEKYIEDLIARSISSGQYKKVFIIGLDEYSIEQKAYFEKLVKLTPQDVLILSFSYNIEKENLIFINACFDNYSIMRIFKFVNKYNLPTTVFVPKCDRNTVSQMIYLVSFSNVQVYVGKCTPILLNPSLIKTMELEFKIKNITSAKNDLQNILST